MTVFIRRWFRLIVVTALGVPLGAASAAALPFTTGSFESIAKAHHGQPFVLVFWSVDCAPCVKEMATLAAVRRQHPEMELVMVSTDETTARLKVDEILTKHGLQGVESWIFSDDNASRLRYQVDANWYGELPRSYFYDAQHHRVALSGGITAEHLDAWLKSVGR